MFNRLETNRRLSRLERMLRKKCCACNTPFGDVNIQTILHDNPGASQLTFLNGVQILDGMAGSYSVEGHLWSGGGIFDLAGSDILTVQANTNVSITIYDEDFNILDSYSIESGQNLTLTCGAPIATIRIEN